MFILKNFQAKTNKAVFTDLPKYQEKIADKMESAEKFASATN